MKNWNGNHVDPDFENLGEAWRRSIPHGISAQPAAEWVEFAFAARILVP
jgi:hypothetical protein